MIEYIKGQLVELSPTNAIIETGGIGYDVQISLQTFQEFEGKENVKVFIHHHLREDEELYYGFSNKDERELFRLLISVSGIGVSTARMMLSSLNSDEIRNAILSEDVNTIKSIKGIGIKTAKRLILELKDKVIKGEGTSSDSPIAVIKNNEDIEEATKALIMLGFAKAKITKVLLQITKGNPNAKVEELIKIALQKL